MVIVPGAWNFDCPINGRSSCVVGGGQLPPGYIGLKGNLLRLKGTPLKIKRCSLLKINRKCVFFTKNGLDVNVPYSNYPWCMEFWLSNQC